MQKPAGDTTANISAVKKLHNASLAAENSTLKSTTTQSNFRGHSYVTPLSFSFLDS